MAENTLKVRLKNRYDTEANWSSKNPVLLAGEIAFSSDKSGMYKVGNGSSSWGGLSYNSASTLYSLTSTITELNYVHGVNSNVQTQLNSKASSTHNHDSVYLKQTGGTISGTVNSSKSSGTFLAGNQGAAIINSTAGAGSYSMLAKMNSTNGYFTHGSYLNKYLLQYTDKTTVNAGTNNVTKSVTLLDESGNTTFPGTISAPAFSGDLKGSISGYTLDSTDGFTAGYKCHKIYSLPAEETIKTYYIKFLTKANKSIQTFKVRTSGSNTNYECYITTNLRAYMTPNLTVQTLRYNPSEITKYEVRKNTSNINFHDFWGTISSSATYPKTIEVWSDNDFTLDADNITSIPPTGAIEVEISVNSNEDTISTTKRIIAPTFTGNLSGNAASATTASKVSNLLTLNGKAYNGSSAVDVGTIDIAYGGTGSTTASGARTNLGAMGAVNASNYWGLASPNGDAGNWIRTTSSGLLPYQSGGAAAGHSNIGTSSWYFLNAYIQNIYGSLKGNADTATSSVSAAKASLLANYYPARQASANLAIVGDGSIKTFKATSSMTEGKPPWDAHMLHFEWDSAAGWSSQLAIQDGSKAGIATRAMNAGTWTEWITFLNSTNYNDYTVSKTGSGASGNWNINALTATTLQTARTVNGTAFNGGSNITTTTWGAARTFKIGNTSKSINGAGNYEYTLSDIGAVNKAGDTLTGFLTLHSDPTANLHAVTKQYVDNSISRSLSATDYMHFIGTVGIGGDITALPTTGVKVGNSYKVISEITIPAGSSSDGTAHTAKLGDTVVATATTPKWAYIPSGDERETLLRYSSTEAPTLTTSAKTGTIILGEGAIKQVDTSITSGSTSVKLPTSAAVVGYAAPKAHSSSAAAYGIGTSSLFGHVKLSDTYNSNVGSASTGIAPSQSALFNVYTTLDNKFNTYLPLTGGTLTGNLSFTDSMTAFRGVSGTMAGNDFWRVGGAGTATDAGYMEVATADGGNEPIYVRQYSGNYTTLTRTAIILDAYGDTKFPGTVTTPSINTDTVKIGGCTIAYDTVSSSLEFRF